MGRPRAGSIVKRKGVYYARVTYLDESGKRKEKWRKAGAKAKARDLCKQIIKELDTLGLPVMRASNLTFEDLARYYAKNYLKPAHYVDGRKIAGLRSYRDGLSFLSSLKEYFREYTLNTITYDEIAKYKAKRIATPTRTRTTRAAASVNRELSLLRRILNIAKGKRWISKNPFQEGDSLINLKQEKKRRRIITKEEESRLFAACCSQPRIHLFPILICALDTGMSKTEILSLHWSDVNFRERRIIIRASNTKKMRERQVVMTERLEWRLMLLYPWPPPKHDDLVFGIKNIRHSFATACRLANLDELRFYDLRHTFESRLLVALMPQEEINLILGRSQYKAAQSSNISEDVIRYAASLIDAFNTGDEAGSSRKS